MAQSLQIIYVFRKLRVTILTLLQQMINILYIWTTWLVQFEKNHKILGKKGKNTSFICKVRGNLIINL